MACIDPRAVEFTNADGAGELQKQQHEAPIWKPMPTISEV
jgi:hypothetical protein